MTVRMVLGGVIILVMGIAAIALVSGVLTRPGAPLAASPNLIAPGAAPLQGRITIAGDRSADKEILVVPVRGPILSHRAPTDPPVASFAGFTFGQEVRRQLQAAAQDASIVGVLIQVATPGGSIGGSEAIHEGILALKKAGKPVGVHIDTLSASGGVWATAAADAIFADAGSLVGSVGVIGPSILEFRKPTALAGVETEDGIIMHTIAAGRGKDLGNPFRAPTEEELGSLGESVDNFYQGFLDHMATHRGIPEATLRDEAGAGIFDNKRAETFGFIDGTATYDTSLEWVRRASGHEGTLKVTTPRVPMLRLVPLAFAEGESDNASTAAPGCELLRAQVLAMSHTHLMQHCGL